MRQISSIFNSKKLTIIKTTCFIAIFVFVFLCLSDFLYLKSSYEKNWGQIYDSEGYDVVFFGNSHANKTFNTEYLSNIDIQSYVISSSGENFAMTYHNVLEVLQNTKVDTIVLELNSIFNTIQESKESEKKNYFNAQNTVGMHLSMNKINKILNTSSTEYYIYNLFPQFLHHDGWKDIFKWKEYYSKNKLDNMTKGYIDLPHIISDELWEEAKRGDREATFEEKESDVSPLTIPDEYYQMLKEIIDLCNEKGTSIVYVQAPVCLEWVGFSKGIIELEQKLDIDVIDYNLMYDDLALTQNDFYDLEHLSTTGALKVTNHFLEEVLVKELGYAVDYSGLEDTLIIKNEMTEERNNEYVYTIDTYNKKLEYAFYIYKDGEKYDAKTWSKENFIVVSNLDPGEYTVKWFICREWVKDKNKEQSGENKASGFFYQSIVVE